MVDTKLVADMTNEQRSATKKILMKGQRGYEDVIEDLTRKQADFDLDESESKRITSSLVDAAAKLAIIRAKITAYHAGRLSMAPPPKATVDKISALADDLDKMIADAKAADTVIAGTNLLTDALENALSA